MEAASELVPPGCPERAVPTEQGQLLNHVVSIPAEGPLALGPTPSWLPLAYFFDPKCLHPWTGVAPMTCQDLGRMGLLTHGCEVPGTQLTLRNCPLLLHRSCERENFDNRTT